MPVIKTKSFKKPDWLKPKVKSPAVLHEVKTKLRSRALHTVCEAARCPNICECFERKTATFMIMGDICTRNCSFCAVAHGTPGPLDPGEPQRVADMAESMQLRYVVVTSVTRDDLPDGGAAHFAETIRRLSIVDYRSTEVLTPDFRGSHQAIKTVLDAGPDVFNHNLETVEGLTEKVRNRANYKRSLDVLEFAKKCSEEVIVKSGIMVGLGESDQEVFKTLDDLSRIGCNIVTIGQYLRPSAGNLEVDRYVPPRQFEIYREYGESAGIGSVFAGPLVRSSYMAESVFKTRREGAWTET